MRTEQVEILMDSIKNQLLGDLQDIQGFLENSEVTGMVQDVIDKIEKLTITENTK